MRPEQARVGDSISTLTVRATPLQLFRYSAVTWNSHKVHYDAAYAAEEGHPGILVHSHLHAAFLTRACTQWAEPLALASLSYKIVHPATPDDTLTISGKVARREESDDGRHVELELELVERNADGQACATGTARLVLALSPTQPGHRTSLPASSS